MHPVCSYIVFAWNASFVQPINRTTFPKICFIECGPSYSQTGWIANKLFACLQTDGFTSAFKGFLFTWSLSLGILFEYQCIHSQFFCLVLPDILPKNGMLQLNSASIFRYVLLMTVLVAYASGRDSPWGTPRKLWVKVRQIASVSSNLPEANGKEALRCLYFAHS